MKNGVVPISVFDAMAKIAEDHEVKDGTWADNVESEYIFYQPRISELRKISKLTIEGKPTTEEVGRAFSIYKCLKLAQSLTKILGEKVVRKELSKALEGVKDKNEKMFLLLLLLPEKSKDQVIMFLESVIRAAD